MSRLFPYANIVAGVLILFIGFGFHWLGQLICVLNWDKATKIGLQEKGLLPEYKAYEHAIAVADVSIGWVYGVAGIGLLMNAGWGYTLSWIPGSILFYHAISAWVWEGNRRKLGHRLMSDTLRIAWCLFNAFTGVLTLFVAWAGKID
jgi:hypothetical protein